MTLDDKKEIKKRINKAVREMKDDLLDMIRSEIGGATGYRYGQWSCECGNKWEPRYRDPRNIRIPSCRCGKQPTFKDVA